MARLLLTPMFVSLALSGLSTPAGAEPVTYALIPGKCSFVAHLLRDGAGARLAHDHVVRARDISGQVRLDPAAPARSEIRIDVDARTLEADAPSLRQKYGMDDLLSASDRTKVERNLRSPEQLDTARFPAIRFRSTSVDALGKDRYKVAGELTIRGKTRAVSLTVKAAVHGDRLKGGGSLRIRQSDFGYQPYSAALGLMKVKDALTLNLYLEGKR